MCSYGEYYYDVGHTGRVLATGGASKNAKILQVCLCIIVLYMYQKGLRDCTVLWSFLATGSICIWQTNHCPLLWL